MRRLKEKQVGFHKLHKEHKELGVEFDKQRKKLKDEMAEIKERFEPFQDQT